MRTAFVASILILLIVSPLAHAQETDTSALINEQLDKLYEDDLNHTLPEAMKRIAEKTGVTIEADDLVWDLLPWGRQTNVTATIKNTTLRQALDAITQKLGLTYALKKESVELQPMSALKRIGKRATVKELEALDLLRTTKLDQEGRMNAGKLLTAIDAKLQAAKSDFAIENRAGNALAGEQMVFITRNATLAEALESLAKETAATWYPWGNSIIVVSKQDQVSTLISERTVNLRLKGVPIGQVLMELQGQAGVDFVVEPGALQRVPAEFRIIQLDVQRKSVKQVLESIAGITGLAYTVNDRGVYLWYNAGSATTGSKNSPIVGQITLDNGMAVFIREDQVGPELKQYLDSKIAKEVEKLRTMMTEEGFTPTPTGEEPTN